MCLPVDEQWTISIIFLIKYFLISHQKCKSFNNNWKLLTGSWISKSTMERYSKWMKNMKRTTFHFQFNNNKYSCDINIKIKLKWNNFINSVQRRRKKRKWWKSVHSSGKSRRMAAPSWKLYLAQCRYYFFRWLFFFKFRFSFNQKKHSKGSRPNNKENWIAQRLCRTIFIIIGNGALKPGSIRSNVLQ